MSLEEFGTSPKLKTERYLTTSQGKIPITVPENECCGDQSEEKLTSDYSQWGILPNSSFVAASSTTKSLPDGFYTIGVVNDTLVYRKKSVVTDELLTFDDTAQQLTEEITKFWNSKELFTKHGFSHRRGYLFYGRAGTGKTSLVKQTLFLVLSQGGIAIDCNNNPTLIIKAIENLRQIEPKRNILCIFEDIDSIIECYGESKILSLLDGENLVDNVLNIATTNYPEVLDKRIVSRPRRFDRIIKVEPPSDEVRKQYFTAKLNLSETEVAAFVRASKGFTYAAMSDLVISTKCFGLTLEDAAERLRDLEKDKSSDEYYGKRVGILP